MSKWVWSILLCGLVGCAGPKKAEKQLKLVETTEQLLLRVSPDDEKYTLSFWLTRFNHDADPAWMADEEATAKLSTVQQMEALGKADVLVAPRITIEPNEWKTIKVAQEVLGYTTQVEWLVDGDLVEMPAHAGFVLKAKVEPQTTGEVHVKGVLCVSRFDDVGEFVVRPFPFEVTCHLNEEIMVYRKTSKWSDQAIQKYNGGEK